MNRIALVEDNHDFRAELAFHLRRAGFEIAFESDGLDVDNQLDGHPCELMVLDLGLPKEDGVVIARRLRQKTPGLGIVMLTARGGLDARVAGLDEGADAYLVKPVDMRELVATLRTVQRRVAAVETKGWSLMPATLTMRSPSGNTIRLTATEMDLLKCLAAAAPAPVSRETLAREMGHPEPDFDYRRLEVAFSRLRRKIEAAHPDEALIRSARGRGYVFASPVRLLVSE